MIGQNEGLPNIEGYFTSHNNSLFGGKGAFSIESAAPYSPHGDVLGTFGQKAIFDASKSNKIYGRSDNVTTMNLSVKYWERIA